MKSSLIDSVIIGTSSWGSKMAKLQGLNMLDGYARAGVNRIDTAPPYGLGLAESFVGDFLDGRDIPMFEVTTKCGISRPSTNKFKERVTPALYRFSRTSNAASKLINLVRPKTQERQSSNIIFPDWEASVSESRDLLRGTTSLRLCFHDIHVAPENHRDLQRFAEQIKTRFGVAAVGFSSNVEASYNFSNEFDFINIDYSMLLRKPDIDCPDICVHSVMTNASKNREDPVALALNLMERGFSIILNPFGINGRTSFERILENLT